MPLIQKGFHDSQRNSGLWFCSTVRLSQKVKGQPYHLQFPDEEGLGWNNWTMLTPLYLQKSSISIPAAPTFSDDVIKPPTRREGHFSSVWFYFLCGRKNMTTFQCISLTSQRQKDIPAFICSAHCTTEGFPINQTGKTRFLFEDKLFPNFQELWFPQTSLYFLSPFSSFSSLSSPSISPYVGVTSRPKYIF